MESTRVAQREWERTPLSRRLCVVRRFRRLAADGAEALAETVPTRLAGALSRTVADTLVSEVLPLLVEAGFLAGPRRAVLRP